MALSHIPLVWMVREAQRAGLSFDDIKLRTLNCSLEESTISAQAPEQESRQDTLFPVPTIEIDPASPIPKAEHSISPLSEALMEEATPTNGKNDTNGESSPLTSIQQQNRHHFTSKSHKHLHSAVTGRIHDVLQVNNGASYLSVISWNIMEYLPFRRMDLQEDGTWKSITWPLPKGEVRDIPANAVIHSSVMRRMQADPEYRPGNLIVGGGGRGVRRAPKEMGMGEWVVHIEEGDPVGECYVRAKKPERMKSEVRAKPMAIAPNGPQGMFLSGR